MADAPQAPDPSPDVLKDVGHPRGTLAIVIIFAVLFALAWFATYITFMGRGAPHH